METPETPHVGRGRPARRLSIAMIGLRGIPATYGGVERAVEALSVELAVRGHDITVYGRNAYSESQVTSYQGVTLRSLPQINTKHLEAASHTMFAIGDAIRSRQFDLIHLHATGPALFSPLLRLARIPCVATVQGLDWQREKWGSVATHVLRLGARISASVPNRTIVVSHTLARVYKEAYGQDPVYIPNGVDVAEFCHSDPVDGLAPGEFLLFLGRLVPEKEVHTLIRAFQQLDTDQRLVIAGPSSHSDDYVRWIQSLAAADRRIVFLGPQYGGEKAWLLNNASLFVQPSTIEGLPIALLEAIACGRYAVISDIPENVEVITSSEGRHGRIFRTGDELSLAEALASALADENREQKGRLARDLLLPEYEWPRIAAQTEAVYQEVLASSTAR